MYYQLISLLFKVQKNHQNQKYITCSFRYDNCFLARTDPKDVARVESKTVISTPQKLESIPPAAEGVKGSLGNWMSPRDLDARVKELFPGCMQGKLNNLTRSGLRN